MYTRSVFFITFLCKTSRETYLGMQCRMHELRNKERISVAAASKILANIVYEYKGYGLSMVSRLHASGCRFDLDTEHFDHVCREP